MTPKHELPHFCSDLCAREALEAGTYEGAWVDTESDEYQNSLSDDAESNERCDWCD